MAGFNVAELPDYVSVNRQELISKSLFGFETRKYVNLMAGVKYAEALPVLSTDPILQDRVCGFDPSGNVDFSQRVMEVHPYKVNMELCEETLRKKFMNDQLVVKAGAETLPFAEKITTNIAENIAAKLETLIWTAKDASNGWDGFLAKFDADSTVIDVAKGTTAYETALNVYKAIPSRILKKAEIFVSEEDFRSIVLEITAKNLYHYNPTVDDAQTIILPGTNTMLHAIPGLNGTGRMVAADGENLYYGFSAEDDAETFDLWYSKDAQSFRLAVKFNIGTQYVFGDEIVVSAAE